MENNLLNGGTEYGQAKAASDHGTDVLSCSDNPGGAACQRGIAQNRAYIDAFAAAGLSYMPGGMQVAAGIGGSVNATMQYLVNGSVNPTDVFIASYAGAFTAETGLYSTMAINAAGGGLSNAIKGDNVLEGAAFGAAGSYLGYKAGNNLIQPFVGNKLAPIWKDTTWIGDLIPTALPEIAGAVGGSATSELIGQGGSKVVDDIKKDKK